MAAVSYLSLVEVVHVLWEVAGDDQMEVDHVAEVSILVEVEGTAFLVAGVVEHLGVVAYLGVLTYLDRVHLVAVVEA